jgi:hypothetical protein
MLAVSLQFAVLAQAASIDRFTNRLSLFNIIEGIQSPRFPLLLPECTIALMLRRADNDPNEFDATVAIDAGGNRVGQSVFRVDFDHKPYVRLISNFQNLPILGPGELQITITIPNAEPIRAGIPVIQIPAQ